MGIKNYLYDLATEKKDGVVAACLKGILFLLSLIYGLALRCLVFFYGLRPYKADCKVISVGNITVGGTGKTSLVEYISRYLSGQGRKVVVISRGYKKKIQNSLPGRQAGKSKIQNYENMGDEPYMLQENLKGIPVIVDKDRVKAIEQAIKEHAPDAVVLDDGLQQWKIKKDLEIVAIDAVSPFGNQKILPRGILRESLSALRRADIFVLTKTNLNPDIQDTEELLSQINPKAEISLAIHKPASLYKFGSPGVIYEVEKLLNIPVALFCGIADPDSFRDLISGLGLSVGQSLKFDDHYHYRQRDLEDMAREAKRENIRTLITTEKDAARLLGLNVSGLGVDLLILRIELKISQNEEGFHNRLRRVFAL
ncbi:MAG: tetraacyldisaccharide 4'-kinase [Candidatus Omnitrophica bacterium]|nr:tetraacyldisaccharide 4'-kinase [Candidatus Omnitrophota bacterium]